MSYDVYTDVEVCIDCGTLRSPGFKYCPNCGSDKPCTKEKRLVLRA